MKNIYWILIAIISFALGFYTMKGEVQNYVQFQGVANEIGFTALCFALVGMSLMGIDYKKLISGLL